MKPSFATTAASNTHGVASKADTRAPALAINNLRHSFGEGPTRVEVLHDIDLTILRGEVVALMGPSGSGKTTLLTLVGCLRTVQQGRVNLLGRELNGAGDRELTAMRRRLGFIFQMHNLHASLTATQNVQMGLQVHRMRDKRAQRQACCQALELVGLGDRLDFTPHQLSGGQKQRVAVARALVGNPEIVLADEPTAALDRESGRAVVELLRRLADHRGTTSLIVTHDPRVLDLADRIIKMEEGQVVEDSGESAL